MMKKVLFALIALFSFVSTWAEDAPQVDVATQQVVIGTGDDAYTVILSTKYVALIGESAEAPEILSITKRGDAVNYDNAVVYEDDQETQVEGDITEEGQYFFRVSFAEGNAIKVMWVPFYVIEPWDGWTRVNSEETFNQTKSSYSANPAYYYYYQKYPWCDVAYYYASSQEYFRLYPGDQVDQDGSIDVTGRFSEQVLFEANELNDENGAVTACTEWFESLDQYNIWRVWNITSEYNPDNIAFAFSNYNYEQGPRARVVEENSASETCRVVTLYNGEYSMPWGADVQFGVSAKRFGLMGIGSDLPLGPNDRFEDQQFAMLLVPSQDVAGEVHSYTLTLNSPTTPYNGENTAPSITVKEDAREMSAWEYEVKYFDETGAEVNRLNVKEVTVSQNAEGVDVISAAKVMKYTAKVYVEGDDEDGVLIGETAQFTVTPAAQLTVNLVQIYPYYNMPAQGDYSIDAYDYKAGDNAQNVEIIGDFSVTNLQTFMFANEYYEYTINGSTIKAISNLDGKKFQNYSVKLITNAQALMAPAVITVELDEDALSKTYGDEDAEITATGEQLILDENGLPTDEAPIPLNPDEVKFIVERTEGENAGTYDLFVTIQEDLPLGTTPQTYDWQGTPNFIINTDGFEKALDSHNKWITGKWKVTNGYTINKRALDDENVIIEVADVDYNAKAQEVVPTIVKFLDKNNVLTADNQDNPYTKEEGAEYGYVTVLATDDYTVGDWANNVNVKRNAETGAVEKGASLKITATADSKNFTDADTEEFQINPVALDLKVIDYVKVSDTEDNSKPYGTAPFIYGVELVEGGNGFVADEPEANTKPFATAGSILTEVSNAITVDGYAGYVQYDPVGTYDITVTPATAATETTPAVYPVAVILAASNYNVTFAKGQLQIKPAEIAIAANDQPGAYIVWDDDNDTEITADDTDGANVYAYIRPQIDNVPVDGVTVTVTGDIPGDKTLADLVELSCETTKVGNSNVIKLTDISDGNVSLTLTNANFAVAKLDNIHLSYAGVDQVLEDHKGQEGIRVYMPQRNMLEDTWNTFVLPFDFYAPTLANKVYYGVANTLDIANTSANNVHFKLAMGTIPANTPFIFKVSTDEDQAFEIEVDGTTDTYDYGTYGEKKFIRKAALASLFFENRTIAGGDDFDYTSTLSAATETQKAAPVVADAAGHKFVGVYKSYETQSADEWFLDGGSNAFKHSVGWELYPNEAYIDMKVASGANVRFFVEEPNGTITEIEEVNAEVSEENAGFAEGWYTINGVKLEGEPTTTGTYIYNGKKVFIKK